MTKKRTAVDVWLDRETDHVRRALENASRYFARTDALTVNTLEAVYGRESRFGATQKKHGSTSAAGHFQLKPATAKQYGLFVSKKNDQRFDIDYASSVAARFLKDLDGMFSKNTSLTKGSTTIGVTDPLERVKFDLGAYNGGQGTIASAQRLAEEAGKDPQSWADVQAFLQSKTIDESAADQIRQYVQRVLLCEAEFAIKSKADKNVKLKNPRKDGYRCTEGHWVTIDDRPVFICD